MVRSTLKTTRGQIIMSSCMGVLQFVGMVIPGVPYAALIGVLTCILEFIPTMGLIQALVGAYWQYYQKLERTN